MFAENRLKILSIVKAEFQQGGRMWWAIFKYATVMVVSVIFGFVVTTNVNAWSPNVTPSSKRSDVKVYHSNPCPGNYGMIAVSGEGSINACIMGENIRVASYFPAQGGVAYAVSFPSENTFYLLDVCQGLWGCVYAEEYDTLAGPAGIYKNFIRNLNKTMQGGVVHYGPNAHSSVLSVSQFAGRSFIPQTVATSQNGKWALVELRSYGFFLINVQTSEVRRIIAPGIEYGYGYDPRVEMTVTNDGSTVAIVGTRMGLWVVSVDEACGDRPTELMQARFIGAVTACAYVPTPTNEYIQNFSYALRPVFSSNDKTLSFDAYSNIGASRHVTLFSDPNTNENAEEKYYLALGDSFTSGEGETDDTYYLGGAANKCHVSRRSYPFLLASYWNVLVGSTACSGATIKAARGQSSSLFQTHQLEQLGLQAPDISTVGLGGNDAGLMGKLKDCLGTGTCKWAGTAESRRSTGLEIKNLYPRLKQFYMDVKIKTLGPVIVVGYPRIVSVQTDCQAPVGTLLNQTERQFMNEAVQYLNKVIQAAAMDSGVEYADIEDVLSGGELCSSSGLSYMNAIRLGDEYAGISALPSVKVIGAESFHPKPEGHARIATKVFQNFSELNSLNTYMNNGVPTPAPALSSYWNAETTSQKSQQAIPFLSKIAIKKQDLLSISFPAFTFKPLSSIALELHSEVKNLGTVESAEDGSLNTTIASDSFEPGFHSVHAIGVDYVENDVDDYDFITVESDTDSTVSTIAAIENAPTPSDKSGLVSLSAVSNTQSKTTASSAILGASIMAAPIQNSTTATNSPPKIVKQSLKIGNEISYNWLVVILIILGLTAASVYLYVRIRQKQPSNPS